MCSFSQRGYDTYSHTMHYTDGEGGDFSGLSDAPLIFLPGSAIDTMSCLFIDINDNEIVENDRNFSITLSSHDSVDISPNSSKSIVITNDDCEGREGGMEGQTEGRKGVKDGWRGGRE